MWFQVDLTLALPYAACFLISVFKKRRVGKDHRDFVIHHSLDCVETAPALLPDGTLEGPSNHDLTRSSPRSGKCCVKGLLKYESTPFEGVLIRLEGTL